MRYIYKGLAAAMLLSVSAGGVNGQMQVERLSRGLVAVRQNQGYFLSWRLLGNDPYDAGFNIYRGYTRLNAEPVTGTTTFTDATAPLNSLYYVRPVIGGKELQDPKPALLVNLAEGGNAGYFDIPLERPANGPLGGSYSPGDGSAGDLNGDGDYEIVFKWDPDNAKDNAHSGSTDNIFLDAVTLGGEHLWRIDLGPNIRAGAHYTQFLVYDFDGNGRAELMVKTAPGTIDGTGQFLSKGPAATANHSAVYRNPNGYILSGPEYITVFDGTTGAELATADYWPARGSVNSWGDNYGNRVDRFNAAVAYVDGQRPSAVFQRGYYSRMTFAVWDWRNGTLTRRWTFDSNTEGNGIYYGQGNHSLHVIDANGDGRHDLVTGSSVISGTGAGIHTSGMGHGDACHVTYMKKGDPRPLIFMPHESNGHGVSLRYADTGELLFNHRYNDDIGRGCAGELDPGKPGFHFWASSGLGLYNLSGSRAGNIPNSINFVIWWDGSLSRELMNSNTIDRWSILSNSATRLLSGSGASSINGTKSTPVLQADLFGDWREEVILRRNDNKALRVYTTVMPTTHKLFTFMHDPVYRVAVSWQNSSYNQPPHPGYYVASDMDFPPPGPSVAPVAGFNRGSGFLIKDLMVFDDINAVKWQVSEALSPSVSVYGDKTYYASQLPGYLEGNEWIKTSYESAGFENEGGLASFSLLRNATLYVVCPSLPGEIPAWLSGFSLLPEKVTLSVTGQAPVEMNIYAKDAQQGDTLLLGSVPAGQQMYFVVAKETGTGAFAPSLTKDADLRIYPNPVKGRATVNFFIGGNSEVSLDLLDLSGNKIRRLERGMKQAGTHAIPLDGSDLTTGVYIVRMQSGNRLFRQKILLVK